MNGSFGARKRGGEEGKGKVEGEKGRDRMGGGLARDCRTRIPRPRQHLGSPIALSTLCLWPLFFPIRSLPFVRPFTFLFFLPWPFPFPPPNLPIRFVFSFLSSPFVSFSSPFLPPQKMTFRFISLFFSLSPSPFPLPFSHPNNTNISFFFFHYFIFLVAPLRSAHYRLAPPDQIIPINRSLRSFPPPLPPLRLLPTDLHHPSSLPSASSVVL